MPALARSGRLRCGRRIAPRGALRSSFPCRSPVVVVVRGCPQPTTGRSASFRAGPGDMSRAQGPLPSFKFCRVARCAPASVCAPNSPAARIPSLGEFPLTRPGWFFSSPAADTSQIKASGLPVRVVIATRARAFSSLFRLISMQKILPESSCPTLSDNVGSCRTRGFRERV